MRNPNLYTVRQIKKWDIDRNTETGSYIPARVLPYFGFRLFRNIKLAFYVFIGRYDALDWEDNK
jgi:hypothetical protein